MLFLFLIFLLLLDADRPQREMVLQPLVLVLVVDEVSQQFPIPGRPLAALNDEVVALVAKIGHRLHVDDLGLNVHQLLVAEGVRADWDLRILDFQYTFQLRRHKLDCVAIRCLPNELFSLFGCLIVFIVFFDLCQ